MTWEETIEYIRQQPQYKDLIEKAYFEPDLRLNAERFYKDEEYQATLALLKKYITKPIKDLFMLDIGAGNGISSVAFARDGFDVCALEPDKSSTIGSGAIGILQRQYQLNNLRVVSSYAEDLPFPGNTFDVVYARQSMHHAYDLKKFVSESYRVLKPGGVFITIRDHVADNPEEKNRFLDAHPLHKFYGGENAFSFMEYKQAFKDAGFKIRETLRHYDSVINYFPVSSSGLCKMKEAYEASIGESLKKKTGMLERLPFLKAVYKKYLHFAGKDPFDEKKIPGRLYSFLSIK